MSSYGPQQLTVRPSEELSPSVQIRKCSEVDFKSLPNIPSFGPVFAAEEHESFKNLKDKSWKYATDNNQGGEAERKSEWVSALKSIECEARAAYADGMLTNLASNDFIQMLLYDACLLLLLVFSWFGADIGYPSQHPVFGNPRNEELRKWMISMFVVGNQIPLIVLETLISQSFFRQAIQGKSQWKQPVGLLETVLYELLLAPALGDHQHGPIPPPTCLRGFEPKPCDLLHGLHLMVLGQGIEPNQENELDVFIRMESSSVDNNAANDAEKFFSAKELSQKRIRFKVIDDRMGIRGICFKPKRWSGVLYLPRVMVDDNTGPLFQFLKDYETAQQVKKTEVRYYLRLLNELVCTVEDAQIMASQGVIEGQFKDLPELLKSGLAAMDINFGRELHHVRLEINYYCRPRWQKHKRFMKYSAGVAAVVVPSAFGALQYFKS